MYHKKPKRQNPYKAANEAFLEAKSKEEGVVALDNGVLYRVLEEGHGTKKPTPRSIVYVHYTGTLLDGKKFDSSVDRGEPFEFDLGVGQVIQCWDMSVARLSVGEKIKVICPYSLAYGERGAGRVIPPKSDLIFEMELIKIEGNNEL